MGIYNMIHNNVSIIFIKSFKLGISKNIYSCNWTPSSEVFKHPKTEQRFSMAMVPTNSLYLLKELQFTAAFYLKQVSYN